MSEWISVNDRLPQPGDRVLLSCGCFVGEGYFLIDGSIGRFGRPWSDFDDRHLVTHWMPLPEPAEEVLS